MYQVVLNIYIFDCFNLELENFRNLVFIMGGEVEQQLIDILKVISMNNLGLVEKVIFNDLKVNFMEMQIDEECVWIIVKWYLIVSDLCLIMIILKVIIDIECMGDEIECIVKLVIK